MKKKAALSYILILTLLFLIMPTVVTHADEDTTELNWYYVPKGAGITPEPCKESVSFLSQYDGYFVGDTSSKVLYLTFDEGYERGNTSAILDTLKEVNVPAAFFLVKPFIESEPELIKRMVKEGHLVCNHSSHHPSMASITDPTEFNKEFTEVEDAFKKLTGKSMPKFFRPPMGKYSKNSLALTQKLGYKTIFWSFAYKDWLVDDQPEESYAIEKIKSNMHPGAIILLHAVSDTNTKILKKVIIDLQKEGYEFKSLKEL